jgi:CelD/BcsL family acetyltransferase involved in cellulose biosynthesis
MPPGSVPLQETAVPAAPSTSGLHAEVLRDWTAVDALANEWNGLLRRSAADSIFLTWEWIAAWREVVGDSVQPLVIVIRDAAGAVVGLGPFYRTVLHLLRLIPYRTLRVLADVPTGAEYPDWIARRDREAEVTRTIAATLAALRTEWDCLWMPRVSGWSGARERILEAAHAEGFHSRQRAKPFAVVALPATVEEYTANLSAKTRKNVRRDTEKILRRRGARVVSCRTPEEIPRFLEALFRLHHHRWMRKGEEGTFRRKPAGARFYERFAPRALAQGWLALHGLEEEGELKAVQIGYVYGGVFHALQEGFDPGYEPGAGNVLRAKVIETCIEAGLAGYDFLGGITPHKERWLAEPREGYDLFLGRRNPRNVLLFWREVWPSGRFLRPPAAREATPSVVPGAP